MCLSSAEQIHFFWQIKHNPNRRLLNFTVTSRFVSSLIHYRPILIQANKSIMINNVDFFPWSWHEATLDQYMDDVSLRQEQFQLGFLFRVYSFTHMDYFCFTRLTECIRRGWGLGMDNQLVKDKVLIITDTSMHDKLLQVICCKPGPQSSHNLLITRELVEWKTENTHHFCKGDGDN